MCIRVHLWLIHPRVIRIVIVDQCLPWSRPPRFCGTIACDLIGGHLPVEPSGPALVPFLPIDRFAPCVPDVPITEPQNLGKHARQSATNIVCLSKQYGGRGSLGD